MPNPIEFLIKRLDDASIYRILKEAEKAGNKALSQASKDESLVAKSHELKLSFNSLLPWQVSEDELKGAKTGQYVLGRATLRFSAKTPDRTQQKTDTVSFEFYRGGPDKLNDTISLNSSNTHGAMNGEGEQSVQRAIHKSLSSVLQPVAAEDGGLIPTLSNLSVAFDTTYRRIADELSSAVETVSKERAEQIWKLHLRSERSMMRKFHPNG